MLTRVELLSCYRPPFGYVSQETILLVTMFMEIELCAIYIRKHLKILVL